MSATEDALKVRCPDCGQPAGVMCIYMPIAMTDPNSWRPLVRAKLDRVGTPTNRPHSGRFTRAWKRHQPKPKPVTPVQQELLATHRAGVVWDRQEYDKLRRWLAAYGAELFGG